ncbi:MAG: hypothetical protein PHR28_05290 [candidate division Zixibacteria bacterium]|nr:hypothetical protein [candidate division Zixibacteria bacterium]
MIKHAFLSMHERRYHGYRRILQRKRGSDSTQPPSKRKRYTDALRTILSDCFMIFAIVSAISFVDYFRASADIVTDVYYVANYYDNTGIRRDLLKYGLVEPFEIAQRLQSGWATVLPGPPNYGPENPIDSFLLQRSHLRDYDSVSRLVRFEFKGECVSYREALPGAIINSDFWENVFFDSLSQAVDSTTLFKALMIVIAHRQINTTMIVYNQGLQDARAIHVYLEPPYLLNPRMLMANGRVTLLKLFPEYPTDQIQLNGNSAVIEIPYLRAGERHEFNVVTSMQNLSRRNIYANYETEKTINMYRFIVILLSIATLYWGIFLYLRLKYR